jgi:hypothetical protein
MSALLSDGSEFTDRPKSEKRNPYWAAASVDK